MATKKTLKTVFFKITNKKECHNGLQYQDGLVKDTREFDDNPKHSCCPGGIYFSDAKNIFNFRNYGPWIREVELPADASSLQDKDTSQGTKYRASKLFLHPRKQFWSIGVFKMLIKNGLNIHKAWIKVLSHLLSFKLYSIIKFFIDNGADAEINNNIILNRFILHGNLEMIKYLVDKGVNIRMTNDIALRTSVDTGDKNLAIVKYLIKQGANVNAQEGDALVTAATNGHLRILKCLVENGASITIKNSDLLQGAACNGHLKIVQYLISKGINVKSIKGDKWDEVIYYSNLKTIKYLVEQGIKPTKESLRYAENSGKTNVYNYLKTVLKK